MSPAYAVAIQADGKIVAVGGTGMYTVGGDDNNFALARYKPDGSLDPSFGSDGRVATQLKFFQESSRRRRPGRRKDRRDGIEQLRRRRYLHSRSLRGRWNAGYIPFGDSAWVGVPLPGPACPVAVEPDGEIVVAGGAGGLAPAGGWVRLARYTSAGSLDPNFGQMLSSRRASGTARTSLRRRHPTGRPNPRERASGRCRPSRSIRGERPP
jgi:uncharacterized delta-60 repeat protein